MTQQTFSNNEASVSLSKAVDRIPAKTHLHYRLASDDWTYTFIQLTRSEIGVYFWVKTRDPFGDRRLNFSVQEIANDLKINKSSVSRALKTLDKKGWISLETFSKHSYANTESQVRDRLKLQLGGQFEVVTAVGRIDLLTTTEVIEVKNINDWKGALGQILAYSAFFPEHSKRIHLFGRPDLSKLALAQATCSEFGITVTFEEVSASC